METGINAAVVALGSLIFAIHFVATPSSESESLTNTANISQIVLDSDSPSSPTIPCRCFRHSITNLDTLNISPSESDFTSLSAGLLYDENSASGVDEKDDVEYHALCRSSSRVCKCV
jgi:hypothetical protein